MLAAIAPSSTERMALALETAARYNTSETGSAIIGTNLEGPFLNRSYSGALGTSFLREPDEQEMKELLKAGQGKVRIVTLAPELRGCPGVVELLSSCGVIPSLGHSGATLKDTQNAIRAGLKHITHIFNAMAPMHHREPGPAGAALLSPLLSAEVIADGIHVHRSMLQLLWRIKGKRLVLVSDATAAAGLSSGTYRLWGQKIVVKGARAEIHGGRLAGSTITMLDAVKNMIKLAGLNLPQALRLASANPAAVLGLTNKGRIAPGFAADLVLLDTKLEPLLVMVEGRVIFRKV
jgi:N-acetylglucosamine-6-phosphate deacetylase